MNETTTDNPTPAEDPKYFFVFDVESVGLHGEGFAVAGGVYLENGAVQYEFCYSCPLEAARGEVEDFQWVRANVPYFEPTHRTPVLVRNAFWESWKIAKNNYPGIVMVAECGWPVEARFLIKCVEDDPSRRNWEGPYPLQEVASFMFAAGMDPMATYPRTPSEAPAHHPLMDARLSARLLSEALTKIKAGKGAGV